MSPTRTSPDGCHRLSWQRREVGRITRSSGARTVKGWRAAMALLDSLYGRDELDVLRALKAGTLTMKEITAAEKAKAFGRGDAVQLLAMRRPLWAAVDAWLVAPLGPTRTRYQTSFAKLRRLAGLTDKATIADLSTVDYAKVRNSVIPPIPPSSDFRNEFRSAADWNHLRRAVSRFLTVTLGDPYHPVRRAIVAKIAKAAEGSGRRVSLTPAEFWTLVTALAEPARAGVVTLAVTGMRLAEYERARPAHLRTLAGGWAELMVQGSKTAGSSAAVRIGPALVPWVKAGLPMPLKRVWFRKLFKRAAATIDRPELRLHDLRHCTAIFALQEGAPINAVRDLMRHEGSAQTLNYTRTGNLDVAAAAVARALAVRGALHRKSHTPARKRAARGGRSA